MGYHKTNIAKGVLGQYSKVREEFEELTDAHEQGSKVLAICELCDLIGAIEAYAGQFSLTLDDLIKMQRATKEAFLSGDRT